MNILLAAVAERTREIGIRRTTEAIVHAGVSVSTLVIAMGAGLVLGLAFGIYPALRASRLTPIEAIRHE